MPKSRRRAEFVLPADFPPFPPEDCRKKIEEWLGGERHWSEAVAIALHDDQYDVWARRVFGNFLRDIGLFNLSLSTARRKGAVEAAMKALEGSGYAVVDRRTAAERDAETRFIIFVEDLLWKEFRLALKARSPEVPTRSRLTHPA